ncbi:hypothetical protein KM1_113550 [Entamoeba histolytica HM-3:IMSS]|uniref:Uncharacterized protein n=1 Tax=Entamoeba histolytica HM-3:IMSS TaxID=885315 RepID=M7WDH3_ENTHI|nr:hypothetical protein KM1_113550 [Entamoeba histolytica HM-3:IMSS]
MMKNLKNKVNHN